MKILYTQPIFLPNVEIFEKNVQSIRSFLNVINNTNIDIDIELGGWGIDDEYWDKFINRIDSLKLPNMNITRFDKNYGKAYIINRLTKNTNDYNYILTADSDIIFKDTPDFMERILEVANKSTMFTKLPFGVMGINQEIANCHLMGYLNKNKHDFIGYNNNQESIRWHQTLSGIADGCLFISVDNWIKIGGYREMGVYAGDDAYILIDTHNNNHSYFLCETITVIHPPENNQEYQDWKTKVCQRDSHGGSTGVDIDKINEATDIWLK